MTRSTAWSRRRSIPEARQSRAVTSDEFARLSAERLAGRPAPTPFAARDRLAIPSLLTGGLAKLSLCGGKFSAILRPTQRGFGDVDSPNRTLFRQEVLEQRADRLHGDVSIAVPISWQIIGYARSEEHTSELQSL